MFIWNGITYAMPQMLNMNNKLHKVKEKVDQNAFDKPKDWEHYFLTGEMRPLRMGNDSRQNHKKL